MDHHIHHKAGRLGPLYCKKWQALVLNCKQGFLVAHSSGKTHEPPDQSQRMAVWLVNVGKLASIGTDLHKKWSLIAHSREKHMTQENHHKADKLPILSQKLYTTAPNLHARGNTVAHRGGKTLIKNTRSTARLQSTDEPLWPLTNHPP